MNKYLNIQYFSTNLLVNPFISTIHEGLDRVNPIEYNVPQFKQNC